MQLFIFKKLEAFAFKQNKPLEGCFSFDIKNVFQSKWKLWIHFFTEILSCGQISENTKTNQSTGHVPVPLFPLFPLQLHQSECYKWQKQRKCRRSRRKENKWYKIMKQMNKEDFFKSLMKISPNKPLCWRCRSTQEQVFFTLQHLCVVLGWWFMSAIFRWRSQTKAALNKRRPHTHPSFTHHD